MQNYLTQKDGDDFIKIILDYITYWYEDILEYCYYCTHFKYNGSQLSSKSEDIHLMGQDKIITYHYETDRNGIKIVYT